jgi:beta-phosphoglucomutase-like phosphatase (HAD superfamily)
MFEDSLKNIRACKAIGMRTVLIREPGYGSSTDTDAMKNVMTAEDANVIDAQLDHIGQIKRRLPFLWQGRFFPTPKTNSK